MRTPQQRLTCLVVCGPAAPWKLLEMVHSAHYSFREQQHKPTGTHMGLLKSKFVILNTNSVPQQRFNQGTSLPRAWAAVFRAATCICVVMISDYIEVHVLQ